MVEAATATASTIKTAIRTATNLLLLLYWTPLEADEDFGVRRRLAGKGEARRIEIPCWRQLSFEHLFARGRSRQLDGVVVK